MSALIASAMRDRRSEDMPTDSGLARGRGSAAKMLNAERAATEANARRFMAPPQESIGAGILPWLRTLAARRPQVRLDLVAHERQAEPRAVRDRRVAGLDVELGRVVDDAEVLRNP